MTEREHDGEADGESEEAEFLFDGEGGLLAEGFAADDDDDEAENISEDGDGDGGGDEGEAFPGGMEGGPGVDEHEEQHGGEAADSGAGGDDFIQWDIIGAEDLGAVFEDLDSQDTA